MEGRERLSTCGIEDYKARTNPVMLPKSGDCIHHRGLINTIYVKLFVLAFSEGQLGLTC